MDELEEAANPSSHDSVGYGVLAGIGLHIVVGALLMFALSLVAGDLAAGALAVCGLTQLVYMVPGILIARSKGLNGIERGLLLVLSLTFLLNASCWGLVIISFA